MRKWIVEFGGNDKKSLLGILTKHKIGMNAYATQLFMNDKFLTSNLKKKAVIVEISVSELGFTEGALYNDIIRSAKNSGFSLCPLELAPIFRVKFLSQEKDRILTLASDKLESDENYPNGFYLQNYNNLYWLRGYRSTLDWIWEPNQLFAFVENNA